MPFVMFGNEELANLPALGDEVLCPRCGIMHRVILGKCKLDDGMEVETKIVAGYKCGGRLFLAGVDDKDVTLYQREVRNCGECSYLRQSMTRGWPTYYCSVMRKKLGDKQPLKYFENLSIVPKWCPLPP